MTLPLAQRSILAATALAFARSLGDFGVTLMVAGAIPGNTQTISVAIFNAVESGNMTLAGTLAVVISAVALVILTLGQAIGAALHDPRPPSQEFPRPARFSCVRA